MLKITDKSEECYTSEIDLFSLPYTQTAIETGLWDKITPKNALSTDVLEFYITPNANQYIDLSKTELCCRVSIRKKAGTEDDKWLPTNNFIHSLFKNIEVKLNNDTIEKCSDLYPYRAYLETLLNFDGESKSTFLSQQGFVKDTPGNFDSYLLGGVQTANNVTTTTTASGTATTTVVGTYNTVNLDAVNTGAVNRKNIVKTCLLKTRLYLYSFNINRYMLNNIEVNINLTRSDPDFCLIYDGDGGQYQINIDECYQNVRKVILSPDVMYRHSLSLHKMNAKYPMKYVEMKKFSIDERAVSQEIPSLNSGILPNRVVLMMVQSDAIVLNSNKKNPFNFQLFDLKTIGLRFGSNYIPYTTKLAIKNNNITELYNTLFSIREASNDITISDYSKGYSVIVFDLTPDLCSQEHYNLLKNGTLSLELEFNNPATNCTLVAYLEFDKIVEVNNLRKVVAGKC